MSSKYSELVNAVLQGKVVAVPKETGVSKSTLRTSVWRELKTLQAQEALLGIDTGLRKKSISVTEKEGNYLVSLKEHEPPKQIIFRIIGEADDG